MFIPKHKQKCINITNISKNMARFNMQWIHKLSSTIKNIIIEIKLNCIVYFAIYLNLEIERVNTKIGKEILDRGRMILLFLLFFGVYHTRIENLLKFIYQFCSVRSCHLSLYFRSCIKYPNICSSNKGNSYIFII